jgi:hypothetical protein
VGGRDKVARLRRTFLIVKKIISRNGAVASLQG